MTVSGPYGQFTTEAVVDPEATFTTTVPASALIEMGIQPHRVVRVKAADGQAHFRQLGRALTTLAGREDIAPVAFGEPGQPAVIGAVTLAVLLLELDPDGHALVAVEAQAGSRDV
jgi:predicted aspartyl protease